jgi:DNA helicase-2/ATP-dependent DNA helicase PcrA
MAGEKEAEGFDLVSFLEHLSLIASIDTVKDDSEAVTLMTLHSAKGLEFPVVFLTGMEESVLPHFRSLYEPAQMEEERRLCYVGITRAQEKLFLTSAQKRSMSGETRFGIKSRFVEEIPGDLLDYDEEGYAPSAFTSFDFATYTKPEEQKQLPAKEIPIFAIGDMVFHNKWGKGRVIEVITDNDEQTLDIQFLRVRKSVMPKYAKIEKVS